MYKIIFLILLASSFLMANSIEKYHFVKYKKNHHTSFINRVDIYHFFYDSKSKICKLSKNSKNIKLFDPRFNQNAPKTKSFRCAAFVKEHYSKCTLSNSRFVSSVALAFGKYGVTNLLIGFNIDHPTLNATVDVTCLR